MQSLDKATGRLRTLMKSLSRPKKKEPTEEEKQRKKEENYRRALNAHNRRYQIGKYKPHKYSFAEAQKIFDDQ